MRHGSFTNDPNIYLENKEHFVGSVHPMLATNPHSDGSQQRGILENQTHEFVPSNRLESSNSWRIPSAMDICEPACVAKKLQFEFQEQIQSLKKRNSMGDVSQAAAGPELHNRSCQWSNAPLGAGVGSSIPIMNKIANDCEVRKKVHELITLVKIFVDHS